MLGPDQSPELVQKEIEQEKQLNRMDDENEFSIWVNNVEKIESPMTQMEQWSILSNMLNYVQHSKFNSMNHSLNVKPVNRYKIKPDEGKEFREVDFWYSSRKCTGRISGCI